MKWNVMLVTAGFILVGVLIDLGWKEISSGYKRNYQNVNKLDEFQSKIELQESQLIFHQMEKEYRGLLESDSNWIPYWNSTEGIVDSKPLSGLIYITEVPMVRIRANCSCNSPQTLLRQIFSTAGMLLLQSLISPRTFQSPALYRNATDDTYLEVRKYDSSLIWPFVDRAFPCVTGINWSSGFYFTKSVASKHFRSHTSDHTEYQKSQFDDILSRFVGDDSVSYTLYAQVLSDDIDRVDECQVTVLMHNAGLLTYPTLNYYYHADYIGKRIVSFIHSLSAV